MPLKYRFPGDKRDGSEAENFQCIKETDTLSANDMKKNNKIGSRFREIKYEHIDFVSGVAMNPQKSLTEHI